MKIFKEIEKNWGLKLYQSNTGLKYVELCASDIITGEKIVAVLRFTTLGEVIRVIKVKSSLKERGYNPYEHRNSFDNDGRIIISKDADWICN